VRPAFDDPRVRKIAGAWELATVVLPVQGVPHVDIAKLVPERGTTAAQRADIAREFKQNGVRHVWFAPARGGDRSLPDEAANASPATAETARQAIDWLLGNSYSMDPEKLRAVIEDALARAGL
jgi:ABC-type Zn uptake system ZnuABC Zn-binding protein ZnuA